MEFEKHLFISYAHIDNQPLTSEQQGWVTRFHASLEAMLSMRLGRKAEIWRDIKLRGNDVFGAEIVSQFPKTALLISVMTPRYVESEWCAREIREFCGVAERSGGVVVDNRSRVIKVFKSPVDSLTSLPPIVQQSLGYEFYALDDDNTPLELDPAYGEAMGQKFNVKLAKLGWDVAHAIRSLMKTEPSLPPNAAVSVRATPAKATVYLAECAYDRRDAREALEAELKVHGYSVLPDQQLPRDESDYVTAVDRLLGQCLLSIHLVGTHYGSVPDGPSDKSVVVLQNEAALARSASDKLRRLIWLPEGTQSDQPSQQRFIDLLQRDALAQQGADLITGSFETLKTVTHATLHALERPASVPTSATHTDSQPLVYLICDERDRKATIPVRRYLKSQGVDVEIPVFEGSAAEVRQAHEELLTRCDGVLVFYGAGNEAWKQTIESNLRRIKGMPRERPLAARWTYLAAPATGDKTELIELEETDLINALEGFVEADLSRFLEALRRTS